ncbi:MAG TPA: hypothetical protein VFH17_03815 [Coriobacteriia bacterium]|nr:hypothetical protein [Coriobacteriia bacterium]
MLTSKISKTVDIPHEPGEWLTIRRLSGKAIERARSEFSREVIGVFGRDMLEGMKSQADADEAAPETEPNPLAGLDVSTVLRCGITAWSYGKRVQPEQVDDLDEVTRDWAAREIIALGSETEAERKNG